MKLLLENVRGFSGKHSLEIKPLTILVGENSSGKTTLLSTLFVALQPDFPTADAFNRSPFELGSYDTIATYRGGKYGRALDFTIGWESDSREDFRVQATFESYLGIPRITKISVTHGSTSLVADFNTQMWELRDGRKPSLTFSVPAEDKSSKSLSDLFRLVLEYSPKSEQKALRMSLEAILALTNPGVGSRPRPTALAPLRTRPHRTYDELIEEFKPEGDHVPLVLARALSKNDHANSALKEALERFGKSSGLFSSLKVRRMGRQPSDPFQVRVKSNGPDANLVDVGYGVSQALPVIVDSYLAKNGRIVLVQQPEVHLHPRAQAELGTFFCGLARTSTKRFVIETHSDYLVDRIRMGVSRGEIPAKDVNIAFLERDGLDVMIHQLSLDDFGNIENAPPAYRSFFLEEELQLMLRGR